MITLLSESRPKARQHHQCFHCYRSIEPGEFHDKRNLKGDGLYSLRFHDECSELWDAYEGGAGLKFYDYLDGYPPLFDEWRDSGEFDLLCAEYRGRFPHAVTRMEFHIKREFNG